MTVFTDNNPAFAGKTHPLPSVRHSARSDIQAKAKPSLRTYDNNGNVIGYWNEDGEIAAAR